MIGIKLCCPSLVPRITTECYAKKILKLATYYNDAGIMEYWSIGILG
jgi:hypothetical protein